MSYFQNTLKLIVFKTYKKKTTPDLFLWILDSISNVPAKDSDLARLQEAWDKVERFPTGSVQKYVELWAPALTQVLKARAPLNLSIFYSIGVENLGFMKNCRTFNQLNLYWISSQDWLDRGLFTVEFLIFEFFKKER